MILDQNQGLFRSKEKGDQSEDLFLKQLQDATFTKDIQNDEWTTYKIDRVVMFEDSARFYNNKRLQLGEVYLTLGKESGETKSRVYWFTMIKIVTDITRNTYARPSEGTMEIEETMGEKID